MAVSPKRICWDACAWIALIQKERLALAHGGFEDRYTQCRSVVALAEKGKVEIVISGLCLVEVCKNPNIKASPADQISAYFDADYILLVPVDRAVGTVARQLMQANHPGLKPADATHVASAIVSNADELNTFDGGLLSLDGKLVKSDGTYLKICKPTDSGTPLPLLKAVSSG